MNYIQNNTFEKCKATIAKEHVKNNINKFYGHIRIY